MSTNNKEQTMLLSEILKWIKFTGMKEVKSTLNSALETDAKKLVYQKSDGTRGLAELAKLAGFGSITPVVNLWNAWQKMGLGESIPAKGGSRFKRSFDLEDFGIEVPEAKAPKVKEEIKKEPLKEESEVPK